MTEGLNIFVDPRYLIVGAEAITPDVQSQLEHSYKMLSFQLLCAKPVVLVRTSQSYPVLYCETMVVPETEWANLDTDHTSILINADVFHAFLEKELFDVSLNDLLSVFEFLADIDLLISFADEHGLIIGAASDCI